MKQKEIITKESEVPEVVEISDNTEEAAEKEIP